MTTQHTPAPWHQSHVEIYSGAEGRGDTICEILKLSSRSEGENQANAFLIGAAPDMLALLQEINHAFYVKNSRKALIEVMAKTKPLIAKAKGGAA